MYILYLSIGGIIGFFIAWFLKDKELKIERSAKEAQKKDVEQLEDKFKSIASEVLRLNSKDFLQLAQKDLEKTTGILTKDFDGREKNFEKAVNEVQKSVENFKGTMSEFEKQRNEQAGALGQSIKQILETGSKMTDGVLTLKSVLSSNSAIRGKWGETVLKNLLEESGLTAGIDFIIQETIAGDESALRPDIIVNLPGELRLAIDSKASLDDFSKAVEEKNEDQKKTYLEQFVSSLKSRIKDLSSKEYQRFIDTKIPYVVMFIPSEAAVRAAFETDPDLYKEAQSKKVMLASPATIMPLLLLIAHAWKQHKSATNAVRLSDEFSDFSNRLKIFFKHVIDIGAGLSQTTKKFNSAVGSWETRVSPKIEQIKILGGNINMEDEIKIVEEEPRMIKTASKK